MFRSRARNITTVFTLGLSTAALPTGSHADDRVYSFGIVPQQSASRLAEMWVPALREWSNAAGITLSFATAKDIPTFEACLTAGAYDFAYMNPYHYTVFHDVAGYEAFAKQSQKLLKGILVVKNDQAYSDMTDLDGSKIAFPSPAAFGASVIPRAELQNNEIDFAASYVKSHDSVYRAVAAGLFDAGGGVMRTFNTLNPTIREQLKVVHQTDGYTPHAFAFHAEMERETVQRVRDALTSSQEGSTILETLGFAGIQSAEDSDWDDVRALKLQQAHTEIIDRESLSCHSD